jgi:hypothetical protein
VDRAEADRLLEERSRLRAARDFSGADAIRDRLAEAGWEVVDSPTGSQLRGAGALVEAEFEGPPPVAVTLLTLVHGWPEDAERWARSLLTHTSGEFEALIAVNSDDPSLVQRMNALTSDPRVRVLVLQPAGWAQAANAALASAAGDVVVLFDPGVEVTGDVLPPLRTTLEDETVAVAGAFGVRGRGTIKEFAASQGPEVDAVEGYCMAFRRQDALETGGFDRKFRFYRIADLELSFRLRAEGNRRAVVVAGLPVIRHEHRLWEATDPAERERLSKRNFYRFLDLWRDREDLLIG